jgi:hypothetical protein
VDSFEHGNEHLGSIKGRVILDQLRVLANVFHGDIFALYKAVKCRASSLLRKQGANKVAYHCS